MATENKSGVLEQVEQIRKMLDTYDELFCSVNTHMTDEEWRPFEKVQDDLYSDVDDRLHLLLDHIDAQAAEIKRLQAELEIEKVERHNAYLDGFADGGEAYIS